MATRATAVALALATCFLSAVAQSPRYTNHTVGDAAGWVFNPATKKPATDYPSWASNKTFSLGDYLIFRTNVNSTVIQTYNRTTYGLCSLDQDYGNLTTQWTPPDGGDGGPGSGAGTIAVPLTQTGENYYFSSTDDGVQCRKGMHFHIVVQRGSGLPPELSQPPPPPPAPATPPPLPPIEATPSTQNEVFYNGAGGGARPGALAVAVGGVLSLLVAIIGF